MTQRTGYCKHCCQHKPSAAFDRWVARNGKATRKDFCRECGPRSIHRAKLQAEQCAQLPVASCGMGQGGVAKLLGVSKARVQQIERTAIQKIRNSPLWQRLKEELR